MSPYRTSYEFSNRLEFEASADWSRDPLLRQLKIRVELLTQIYARKRPKSADLSQLKYSQNSWGEKRLSSEKLSLKSINPLVSKKKILPLLSPTSVAIFNLTSHPWDAVPSPLPTHPQHTPIFILNNFLLTLLPIRQTSRQPMCSYQTLAVWEEEILMTRILHT